LKRSRNSFTRPASARARVTAGGVTSGFTLRVAGSLTTSLKVFATRTRYCPALAGTATISSTEFVSLLSATSLKYHWYQYGSAPVATTTYRTRWFSVTMTSPSTLAGLMPTGPPPAGWVKVTTVGFGDSTCPGIARLVTSRTATSYSDPGWNPNAPRT